MIVVIRDPSIQSVSIGGSGTYLARLRVYSHRTSAAELTLTKDAIHLNYVVQTE